MSHNKPLELLDLFAGLCSFSLAAHRTGEIVTKQLVEISEYCQKVAEKNFPEIPCHADITTYIPSQPFDILTAGFPCQDISSAGHKKGLAGDRSGLFFEVIRIARIAQPSYIVLENSPRLLSSRGGKDFTEILWALSELGFNAEWSVVSACSLGAPHMRKRLLLVAYSNSINWPQGLAIQQQLEATIQNIKSREGFEFWADAAARATRRPARPTCWMDKHRRKAVGNTIAPPVAELALSLVLQIEKHRHPSRLASMTA
jgi:DNA (cytosine-5)-methyltransferase 1